MVFFSARTQSHTQIPVCKQRRIFHFSLSPSVRKQEKCIPKVRKFTQFPRLVFLTSSFFFLSSHCLLETQLAQLAIASLRRLLFLPEMREREREKRKSQCPVLYTHSITWLLLPDGGGGGKLATAALGSAFLLLPPSPPLLLLSHDGVGVYETRWIIKARPWQTRLKGGRRRRE